MVVALLGAVGEAMEFLGGIISGLKKEKKTQIQMVPKSFIIMVMLNMFLIAYAHRVIICLPYFKYAYV